MGQNLIINIILIFVALQGLVLGALLIKRRGNRIANRILSFIIYYISFSILIHVLSHIKAIPFEHSHKNFIAIISIINAPLIYFYTKSLTVYKFKFKVKDLLHLIPLMCTSLLGLPLTLNIFNPQIQDIMHKTIIIICIIVFSIYILYSYKLLLSYAKLIKDNYSSIGKINLNWLRVFIICLILFWSFAGIAEFFFIMINWDLIWLTSYVIILLIGYFGFMQPEIFSGPSYNNQTKLRKYERSSLTKEKAREYLHKLESAMKAQKLYMDENINLSSLSQKLGITIHHLSQIINEQLESNFYDYINSQRIEVAKRLLTDHNYSHQNITTIGFDVGFNSLSAFNTAFKKFTHQTPSQFRKKNSV